MDVRKIKTAPGLEFDCSLAGSPDGVPVLLLHGFGVSRHFWDRQVPALADAGYFAIAPNQRGYSPGARPDPKDLDAYHIDRLVGDALDIVAAAGHGGRATQKAITCRTNHTQKRPSITRLRRSPTALPPSSTARTNMGRPKSSRRRLSSTPRPLASIPSKRTRNLSHRSNCCGRPGHTPAFRLSQGHHLRRTVPYSGSGQRWTA